jgi:hypothetical protein
VPQVHVGTCRSDIQRHHCRSNFYRKKKIGKGQQLDVLIAEVKSVKAYYKGN